LFHNYTTIEQDAVKLNEKVIPLMNISRRNELGKFIEEEPHAQKIYVTTAGSNEKFGALIHFASYHWGTMNT
jgi:hypothetical protein